MERNFPLHKFNMDLKIKSKIVTKVLLNRTMQPMNVDQAPLYKDYQNYSFPTLSYIPSPVRAQCIGERKKERVGQDYLVPQKYSCLAILTVQLQDLDNTPCYVGYQYSKYLEYEKRIKSIDLSNHIHMSNSVLYGCHGIKNYFRV